MKKILLLVELVAGLMMSCGAGTLYEDFMNPPDAAKGPTTGRPAITR